MQVFFRNGLFGISLVTLALLAFTIAGCKNEASEDDGHEHDGHRHSSVEAKPVVETT